MGQDVRLHGRLRPTGAQDGEGSLYSLGEQPYHVLTAWAAYSTRQNEAQQTIRPARGVAKERAADLEFMCACQSASAMTQVRLDRPDMCCTNHRKVEITARSMQPWPRYGRPA